MSDEQFRVAATIEHEHVIEDSDWRRLGNRQGASQMNDKYARGRKHAREQVRIALQQAIHECTMAREYAQFLGVDGLDMSKVLQAQMLIQSALEDYADELGSK
jgi:hypothetical protein